MLLYMFISTEAIDHFLFSLHLPVLLCLSFFLFYVRSIRENETCILLLFLTLDYLYYTILASHYHNLCTNDLRSNQGELIKSDRESRDFVRGAISESNCLINLV